MMLRKMKIKKFIQSISQNRVYKFSDTDNLIKTGIINSVDLLKVIQFLKSRSQF